MFSTTATQVSPILRPRSPFLLDNTSHVKYVVRCVSSFPQYSRVFGERSIDTACGSVAIAGFSAGNNRFT
jgi:hypothetical protein